MDKKQVQYTALCVFGAAVLWVAWGNAVDLLFPTGQGCLATDTEGLHLDSYYQLVYTYDYCLLTRYEYVWPAFLGLSVMGNASFAGGAELL